MNQFNIPTRYTEVLNNPPRIDARLWRFSKEWFGDCGMVLCGPSKAGKSLAAAIALARVANGTDVPWALWVRSDELSRVMSGRDNIAEVEKLKSALVLVVDELGYERFPEIIFEVIGSRYDRSLPTVVTSGLSLEELTTRYSDSVISKITEIGRGRVIDCWREPSKTHTRIGSGVLPPAIIYARTPKSVLQARAISENLNAGRLI